MKIKKRGERPPRGNDFVASNSGTQIKREMSKAQFDDLFNKWYGGGRMSIRRRIKVDHKSLNTHVHTRTHIHKEGSFYFPFGKIVVCLTLFGGS